MGVLGHIAGGSEFYPYKIDESCRFNSAGSAYTSRAAPNAAPWNNTMSFWVKRGKLGTAQYVIAADQDASNRADIFFNSSDQLNFYLLIGGVAKAYYQTDMLFRDTSSWYHIVIATTGNAASAALRLSIYVNGVEFTDGDGLTPSVAWSTDSSFNINKWATSIGRYQTGAAYYFDGYLSEFHMIDQERKVASDFGTTRSGVWVPKRYTGAYGAEGFYLDFANSSDFGSDQSGNANDFTDSGLATNDQVEDTPTNNWCVVNESFHHTVGVTATSDGNLTVRWDDSGQGFWGGTHFIPSGGGGKWYYEILFTHADANATKYCGWYLFHLDGTDDSLYLYNALGQKLVNDSAWGAYGDTFADGDVIGVAIDMDVGSVTFYKNNVSQGVQATGQDFGTGVIPFGSGRYQAASTDPAYNTIIFGQNGFTYTPPAGYKAINTYNFSEPTILEGNRGMDAVIYAGTGAELAITDLKFSPDLVWLKNRDGVVDHSLYDTVRLATNYLASSSDAAEGTYAQTLKSFDANGFTLGTSVGINNSGDGHVSWNWKEDPKYGFDMVSYEGTGVARTVSHNLGVVPEMMIVKNRDSITDWSVFHSGLDDAGDVVWLNKTAAAIGDGATWNATEPTSSVFTVGISTDTNENTSDHVAYLFASVEGFSQVFKYRGNGSADGPFVYCGFRPRFIMCKSASAVGNWDIHDTERVTYNVDQTLLFPNAPNAEADNVAYSTDILSNGFKFRDSGAQHNSSGVTYIGIAFAEHSFKYANAR